MSSERDRFFISYRRSDAPQIARDLHTLICGRFGASSVFLDRQDIPLGTEFPEYLQFELERCCAALVVIGPSWLEARFEKGPQAGRRRLDDPRDYVRYEIEASLDQCIRVIPVLAQGASMPDAQDLPAPLRPLLQRNYFRLAGAVDDRSCAPLLEELGRILADPFRDDVVRNREELYVYVSFHRYVGEAEPTWHRYNCRIANRFQQLLDEIYTDGEQFLPVYSYGRSWVLSDPESGRTFDHLKMIEGVSGTRVADGRLLSELGIRPGMLLLVLPREGDTTPSVEAAPVTTDEDYRRAAGWVRQSHGLLIAAGAGMGVDSGLPDFRGDDGFWREYPAFRGRGLSFQDMANPRWFREDPAQAWGFYGHRLDLYRRTRPHAGFALLRAWADRRPAGGFVFTSNVDGQFQAAGFDDERIVECHGSIHHLQCTAPCSRDVWPVGRLQLEIDEEACRAVGELPRCSRCGGLARPNILMFQDSLWIADRTRDQQRRYVAWLAAFDPGQLVAIECGAGTEVPSVRFESEQRTRRVIRINPRQSSVPQGGIALTATAREALDRLDELASPDAVSGTGDDTAMRRS